MKLADLGMKSQNIRFVGTPMESPITTTDGELYYSWQLKEPIIIRCSVDPLIDPVEVTELYIRESAQEEEIEGTEADGYFIKGWKADFSKTHQVGLYQATTIAQYFRDSRTEQSNKKRLGINEKMRIMMEERKKQSGN